MSIKSDFERRILGESVTGGGPGSPEAESQGRGNSDDFLARANGDKPRAVFVRPESATWDYNDVMVRDDTMDAGDAADHMSGTDSYPALDSVLESLDAISALLD